MHSALTGGFNHNIPKILLLHRFDKDRIEHGVSQTLIPTISKRAICLRILQAGNKPGEPGYWLHLFQLLSGLVDAVITVEVASETYSDNILFENAIIPQLIKGKTPRAAHFALNNVSGDLASRLLRVPVLTLLVDGIGLGDFVLLREAGRKIVHISADANDSQLANAEIERSISDLIKEAHERNLAYQNHFCEAWLREQLYFVGLIRHPLVADALDFRFNDTDLRDKLSNTPRTVGDQLADRLLNDSATLKFWAEMELLSDSGKSHPPDVLRKISSVQARRWGWIIADKPRSKVRSLIYQKLVRLTTFTQSMRLRVMLFVARARAKLRRNPSPKSSRND